MAVHHHQNYCSSNGQHPTKQIGSRLCCIFKFPPWEVDDRYTRRTVFELCQCVNQTDNKTRWQSPCSLILKLRLKRSETWLQSDFESVKILFKLPDAERIIWVYWWSVNQFKFRKWIERPDELWCESSGLMITSFQYCNIISISFCWCIRNLS